jgi:hypothetical protein
MADISWMRGKVMQRYFVVLIGIACASPACAATIVAVPGGPEETGAIVVSGVLQAGDDEVFSKQLMKFPKGIVVLSGDGGDLQAAIRIGTAIRLKNYATLAPTDSRCVSACAIAWLGGAPRVMEDGSKIGFHAAYALKDGQAAEAAAPNALLGAYLNKIGLPDRAIVYVTESPPEGMTWFSAADAQKMGIDVKTIASSKTSEVKSTALDMAPANTPTHPRQKQAAKHPLKLSKPALHAHANNNNTQLLAWIAETFRHLSVGATSTKDDASRGGR